MLSAFSPRIQVTKLRHKTLAPLRNSEVLAGLCLWSLHCPSGVDKYTPHSSCRPNIWWVHLESSASLHHVNVSLSFCLEGLDHMQILVACCRAAKAKEVFRALAIPNSPLVHHISLRSIQNLWNHVLQAANGSKILYHIQYNQLFAAWADLSPGQLKTFLEKDAKRGFQCAGPLLRFSLFEVGTVGVSAIGQSATKLVRSAGKRRASRRFQLLHFDEKRYYDIIESTGLGWLWCWEWNHQNDCLPHVNSFCLWPPCQGGLFICIRTENHAISDGWSNPLMLQEAIQFYTGACCYFAHQGMVLRCTDGGTLPLEETCGCS